MSDCVPPPITPGWLSTVFCTSPKPFVKTSSRFFPLSSAPGPEDDGRFNNWGLCLAILAFVGEGKDGRLSERAFAAETGIRLGVAGASPGTDVVGDTLRRFGGVRCIVSVWKFYLCSILSRGNARRAMLSGDCKEDSNLLCFDVVEIVEVA